MIALYIIAGIAVFLFSVSMIPGALQLSCHGITDIGITARVCGICVFRRPIDPTRVNIRAYSRAALERRKKKERKKAEKKARKDRKKQKNSNEVTGDNQKKSMGQIMDTVSLVITMVNSLLSRLGDKSRLTVLRWHVTVATGDAATTAITYGAVVSATELLFASLREHTRVAFRQKDEQYTVADFVGERSCADITLRISLRVWQIVALLVGLGIDFLNFKKETNRKEVTYNGRKQ